MAITQPSFESCKRYFHQEMPEMERYRFENRVQQDDGFRAQAAQHLQALQALGRDHIRGLAADGFAALKRDKIHVRRTVLRYSGAAAILLMAIGLTFYFPRAADPQTMFAVHYAMPAVGARDMSAVADQDWQAAMDAYRSTTPDFPKAAALLEGILENPAHTLAHRNAAHLYLGISQLEMQETEAAIAAFAEVDAGNARYYGDAVWYTALSYLQLQDVDAACLAFQAISNNPRWPQQRREEAAEICAELACAAE